MKNQQPVTTRILQSLCSALALSTLLIGTSFAEPQRESGSSRISTTVDLSDLIDLDRLHADHEIFGYSWVSGPSAQWGKANTLRVDVLSLGDAVYGNVKILVELWFYHPVTKTWSPTPVTSQFQYVPGSFVSQDLTDVHSLDFDFGKFEPGTYWARILIDPDEAYNVFPGGPKGTSLVFDVKQPRGRSFFKRSSRWRR